LKVAYRLSIDAGLDNGVIALILRFSLILVALLADYVTGVEDRPIMSLIIVSRFHFSTFGHN